LGNSSRREYEEISKISSLLKAAYLENSKTLT